MKTVGKTTGTFRYDLNQIPYDYTVEVRNKFKELDLIDRVPDELWTEVHDIVQETGIKTIPMEKKCKKAKWLSEEALQIAVNRRETKSKGEKERYSHQIASIHWIMEKAREFQKNIYFCFIDYAKAFDCVDHKKLWKILKEMGIPDHLTCLLRNL